MPDKLELVPLDQGPDMPDDFTWYGKEAISNNVDKDQIVKKTHIWKETKIQK